MEKAVTFARLSLFVNVLVLVLVLVRSSHSAPLPSPSPSPNEVSLGLQFLSSDRTNPEFLEYRDVPQGFVVPSFRFSGRAGDFDYDLSGRDAGQDDQRFAARLATDKTALTAHFDDLPHNLGTGHTPFGDGGAGRFTLPVALRRDVQATVDARAAQGPLDPAFLTSVAQDVLAGGRDLTIGYVDRTACAAFALEPAHGLALRATFDRRHRDGTKVSGLGFGLMNAVEVAEPVDETTDDATLGAELERGWGVVRASVGYSAYRNDVEHVVADNPMRATDATAPGAQLGPSERTTAGAARAAVAALPDNDALSAAAGAVLRLPLRTRLSADVTLARWRPSGGQSLAYTTNSTIVEASSLAAPTVEGSIHTGSQTVLLTASPWSRLSIRARFRRYEMDNRTERVELPGLARLDAVWEAVPRRTVPYSHSTRRGEASIGYALGGWRLEAGGRWDQTERTFRETDETRESAWTGILSGALPREGHLRLFYERAHRGFEAYDSRLSPGASRVNVHPVRSLGGGRRYDQAVRDRDRVGARVEMALAAPVMAAASYTLDRRVHPETPYGLVETQAHAASADVSVAPDGAAWSAHAFYAFERASSLQRVRHSPLPAIAIDLRNVWEAAILDVAHSAGAGLAADLDRGRATLRLDVAFQRADGTGDFDSPPGGIPDLALDIEAFDDVRWLTVAADLERRLGGGWAIGAGAAWDSQAVGSVFDEDRPDYVPGAFVLGPGELDYGVFAVQARLTRRW